MGSQVAILVSDDTARRHLAEGLTPAAREAASYEVAHYMDAGTLARAGRLPDVILIDPGNFNILREREPTACLRLSRHGRILLVLPLGEALDAAPVLPLADAWIFTDHMEGRMGALLALGREAHTALPAELLSRSGLDRMRLTLLHRLSDVEYRCLLALGQGSNNRDIATSLALSEAMVKSLVRSTLNKLHFRNRTEAGVFAARNAADLPAAQPGPPPHYSSRGHSLH